MDTDKKLLLANQAWVAERLELDPTFFERTSAVQEPAFLWIGCSDSRVPAEEITGTQPGELFVHRNIANLVIHTDFNLLSVLQYAVEVLKVRHVIVCGHYGCGGVRTALKHNDFGLLNKWLRHIKDVYHDAAEELDAIQDANERFNRLVELNTIQQVHNLTHTSIVQRAWALENRPVLHGWVYQLSTGYLKPLCRTEPSSPVEPIYRFDFPEDPPHAVE